MKDLIRMESLENGLIIEFFDRSNRYFGDYHRVCVEASCRVALNLDVFAGLADPAAGLKTARSVLGNEVVFVRRLERMGVAGEAVARTRAMLIDSFIHGSFSYLSAPEFPGRFVAVELDRRRQGRRPHWPGQ